MELPQYAELRVTSADGGADGSGGEADDGDDDAEDLLAVADPLATGATTGPTHGDVSPRPSVDGVAVDELEEGDLLVHDSDSDLAEAAVDPDLPPPWAGDPGLLEDFGLDAVELVDLVTASQDDPGSVVADIGERCGFVDLLDALR